MDSKAKTLTFTLKDVGSEVVEQLSKDIYPNVGSIFRELTKNAYDAYVLLPYDAASPEDRKIKIQTTEFAKGSKKTWVITIHDDGIGQDIEDLKGNLQIGLTSKKDFDHLTGFRGLGSWSIMGAGNQVRITTSKIGVRKRLILSIEVEKIYLTIEPSINLDQILNNKELIYYFEEDADSSDHFTTVEIFCDGPERKVGKYDYEINRLWPLAEPGNKDLEDTILSYCAIPYSFAGGAHKEISDLYKKIQYQPIPISLNGNILTRSLPGTLVDVRVEEIKLNKKPAAWCWLATTEELKGKQLKPEFLRPCNIMGPSFQLLRQNVPIGKPGLFKPYNRSVDQWYVGEVHVIGSEILPNASGDDLRQGSARDQFAEQMQEFYKRIEVDAEKRSGRKSAMAAVDKALKAQERLDQQGDSLSQGDVVSAQNDIRKGVEILQVALSKAKTNNETEQLYKDYVS